MGVRVRSQVVVKDHGGKAFFARAAALTKGIHAKVGILEEKGAQSHGELNNAELYALHELGSADGHIPARPSLSRTIQEKRDKYVEILRKGLEGFSKGKITIVKVFSILGSIAAADVKKTITDGLEPPNAPSTIAAKGSSKPLIDTAQMMNAITYEVAEGPT